MKPHRSNPLFASLFRSNTLATAVVVSLTGIAAQPSARAANLYWDGGTVNIAANGDGASGGTAGNWNTTVANWDQGSGLAHVAWNNASQDTALFGGTAGTVTLTTPATAGALTVTTAGYTLAGTSPNILTLGGTAATITASALATTATTTISVPVAGTLTGGLTIASSGDTSATGGGAAGLGVRLSGVNSFTGAVTITSGLVSYAADSAFGNAANSIVLNGGGLLDNSVNLTLNRNVQVAAGGGVFRLYGAATGTLNGVLSGSGAFSHTDGGTLILPGNNTYSGTFTNSGGTTTFTGTNAAATYNVNGGVLQIGNNGGTGSLNAASTVNLAAAGTLYVRRTDSVTATSILPATINFAAAGSRFEYNPTLATAALNLNQDIGALAAGVASTGYFRVSGGTLTLASGTDVAADTLSLGLQTGTNVGTLNIGPGSTLTTRFMNIGETTNNSGVVNQTGGTVTVQSGGNGFRLGHWGNGTNPGNVYNLSGGTLDTTAVLATVSWDGAADFNLSGGTWKAGAINFDGGAVDTAFGRITITPGGTLEANGAIGGSSTASEGIFLSGGTLKAMASSTWNSVINASPGTTSTLDSDGFVVTLGGNLTGTGTINVLALPIGSAVKFSTTGSQTVSPAFTGSTEIQKAGSGTTTLSGTSTHSGDFFVDAGRLNIKGSIGSNVTVANPATTLGGEGTSTHTVTFSAGTSLAIDPATPEALTVNNLDLSGQPVVTFDSLPLPAQDPVKILTRTGTLTSPNGIAADLVISGLVNYRTPVITDTAGVVTFSLGNKNIAWNGSDGGQWDVKTSSRWNAGSVDVFAWGDAALFDDTGVSTNITISGELQPSSIVVNSSANNYTITGSTGNFISGTTGLLKSGSSILTLNGPNTFTGGVVISQGTIQIQSASALGAGSVTMGDTSTGSSATALYIDTNRVTFVRPLIVSANGTGTVTLGTRVNVGLTGAGNGFAGITLNRDVVFDSNAADRTDYSTISGTGNITVGGAGRTVFPTVNTFVGNLTINSTADANGLQLGTNSAAFNAIPDASGVTVNAGGKLSLSYTAGGSETISGLNGAGKVRNNGGNANTLIVGGSNGSGSFAGTIENGGGTISLTKTGTGTQTLAGANTYTGVTTVSAGILQFATQSSLYNNSAVSWTPANLKVASGGILAFNVGGTDEFTSGNVTTLLTNLKTIVSNGLQAGSAVGFNTTNAAGGTFTISDIITNSTGTGSGAVGVAKLGTGTLVLSGANTYTGTTNVLDGTLQVDANNGGKIYSISTLGTLQLGYNTGPSVYGFGVTVNGSGTAASTGLYLKGGFSYTFQSGLSVAGAPTTVRAVASTGSAVLSGWDSNGTHLSIPAAASGTVFDSNINFVPGSFGYVMNIASGANTATGDVVFQGNLTGGVNGNNAAFRKTGAGSLLLTGSGSNSALVDIRDGSVILGATNPIGSGAIVNLGSGATSGKLVLNGNDQTLAGLTSAGSGAANKVVGASATLSTLTVGNTAAGTFAATLGGAGTHENNLAFAKSGTGTFTLTGTNTFTGGTTVSGGTLALGSLGAVGTTGMITMTGGTLQFSAANTTDYSATGRLKLEDDVVSSFDTNSQAINFGSPLVLGTFGTGGLGKTGAGTLTLSANQSFTGETIVTAGTLVLDYTTANGSKLSDSGYLTLAGGTLSLSGGNHAELVQTTDVTGNSVVTRTSGTATINLGFIARTGTSTLNITGDGIARTTMGNDISGKLPSWITVNGLPAANDGSGNIIAYSGFYNVVRLGGSIPNNPANNIRIINGGTSGNITPASAGLTDISTLLQDANAGPAVVALGASDTLRLGAVGAIQVPATSGSLTLQGGTLTAGGTADTDGEIAVDASAALTISSPIMNNGVGVVSLSKVGSAALILAEANDFSGGTTLTAGELRINHALALGLGALTISGGSIDNTSGAPILIGDNIPQNWNADVNFTGSNDLEFSAGTVTLGGNRTVTVSNGLLRIGGAINGAYTLTKAGSGTLIAGGGSWSGLTTVTGGTLEVLAKSGDVPYVVGSGATLKLGYATGGNYAATNIKLTGDGTAATTGLYLKDTASYNASGGIELLAAPTTIRHEGTGVASIGIFDINANAITTVAASSGSVIDAGIEMVSRGYGMSVNVAAGAATATGDLVLNGPLNCTLAQSGNTLGFYKRGAGSLALNGVAGSGNVALQIQGGSVIAGIANAIGSTASLPISGGAKLVLNGFSQEAGTLSGAGSVVNGSSTDAVLTLTQGTDQTFTGTLGGATANENNFALVKSGAAKLTLSAANTYTGNTTVDAGTLSLASPFLANGSDVRITTGAVLDLNTGTTDVIDELFLDGSPQAAGVYGAVGSGAQFERSFITGTGTLTVTTGAAGFSSWITGFGLALVDQDPTDDPDGDALSNILEYVLGGNPSLNDASAIAPTGTKVGSNFIFTFNRSDLSESDTTLFVEYGSDLTVWGSYAIGASPGTAPVGIQEDVPTAALDKVTVTLPTGGSPTFFARLKVVK